MMAASRSLFPPKFLNKFLQFFVLISCTTLSSSAAWGSSKIVSTGLRNLGNTCYLNAQLQCAFHIPAVRNIILSPELSEANSDTESCDDAETVGLKALRVVFLDMAQAAEKATGPVSTRVLCRGLGIPVFEQQDSQEFWKLLLPALNEPQLTDLYQGAFEDYIVALDDSGRAKRREEPFLDLSLDVSGGSIRSALADLFGEPELLSNAEGNGWRPENGAEKVDAHKGSLLRTPGLPSILQLHLKRFQYDWNTDTTSKLNAPFTFPEVLDLSDVCEDVSPSEKDQCVYELQAILIHAGQYGSGHYYSYVRPNVRRGEWCRFNDDLVTRGLTFSDVSEDAFGGGIPKPKSSSPKGFFGFFRGWFGGSTNFGYGGESSNAYVLQYVRKQDVPALYTS